VTTTLVLGIGNVLLRDEGAGVHAAAQLKGALGADADSVRVLDAGTLGFALLPEVQGCTALIVIDAARENLPPGTVTVREGAAMDAFVRRRGRSVHEVGVADLLDMARLSDRLPARRALVGIEPGAVEWGVECTPAVSSAVPIAVARVLELFARWSVTSPTAEVEHAG
jgi:hydrogenase maturation protease